MACGMCHYFEYELHRLEVVHREASRALTIVMKVGRANDYKELKAAVRKAKMYMDLALAELKQHQKTH